MKHALSRQLHALPMCEQVCPGRRQLQLDRLLDRPRERHLRACDDDRLDLRRHVGAFRNSYQSTSRVPAVGAWKLNVYHQCLASQLALAFFSAADSSRQGQENWACVGGLPEDGGLLNEGTPSTSSFLVTLGTISGLLALIGRALPSVFVAVTRQAIVVPRFSGSAM